ncbi:MAG: HAD-IIIC family phosphatase [Acidobacteriia bacterium]|nr:HAD-IIIC family phosphatase [Terriglobia bacterium]
MSSKPPGTITLQPPANPTPTPEERGGLARLKDLAMRQDPQFFSLLRDQTLAARACERVLLLSSVRKRAAQKGLALPQQHIRVAIIGGYTPYPLNELIGHFLSAASLPASYNAEFLLGDYDNYISEILDESSRFYEFKPEVIVFLPSHRRCQYSGHLFDARDKQEAEGRSTANQILELCRVANSRTGAEVILTNFPLPGRFDPGPYRTRTLGSDWSFRKFVNLELGLNAPSYVHICDAEFLSARRGTIEAWDARGWFESKQPYGPDLLLDVARESAHLVTSLRQSPKKVVVLDLDNTLWGGVIGDDGLDGIEIGDTSPRGEAFKAFQQYLLSLTHRGILLAVCSKNDYDKAVEPFEKHPEMVLRMKDLVAFKANWQPKSENIRQIADELNLGLDSLVFIDDNPAEIEIVRQFVPEVETLLLSEDPSEYVGALQDTRYFEPKSVTAEDLERVGQYKQEAQRHEFLASVTDMDAYLDSLGMAAVIREFRAMDVPRISQLINKSNQFNLTTRRRTEAQVQAVMADPAYFGFTVRLADRFGDHGLISVVIGKVAGDEAEVDTWLMSCRVLKRQVEEEVLNEFVRLARMRDCSRIKGVYLPSAKNGMVRNHYPALGFTPTLTSADRLEFELRPQFYTPKPSRIRIAERAYDTE